jgi:succinyl-CoA synthetase beta subunit
MMMMDLLADHGLTAACFMDNLRGAPDETMAERLRIARMIAERPQVRAIVFQTVLASRSLADRMDAAGLSRRAVASRCLSASPPGMPPRAR